MAARCALCGKGKQYGHLVSHAKNRVNRIWRPNLQVVTVKFEGVKQRLMLCSRCLRLVKADEKQRRATEKAEAIVATV